MTNEDHLIEANELLRKELDESRAEVDRMERRPMTSVRVSYIALLAVTVVTCSWEAFTTHGGWPIVFAVVAVKWIAGRLRDEDDPDGKRWTARQWREWYSANHAQRPDEEDDEETEAEATRVRVDEDVDEDDASEDRSTEHARTAKR